MSLVPSLGAQKIGTMRHDNNLEGSHKSVVEAGIIGTNRKDGGGWDGDHRRLIRNIYLSMSFLLGFSYWVTMADIHDIHNLGTSQHP